MVTDDQLLKLLTVLLATLIVELAQITSPPMKTAQLALQPVVKNTTNSAHPALIVIVQMSVPLAIRILPLGNTVTHLLTPLSPSMYGIYPLVLLQHQEVQREI